MCVCFFPQTFVRQMNINRLGPPKKGKKLWMRRLKTLILWTDDESLKFPDVYLNTQKENTDVSGFTFLRSRSVFLVFIYSFSFIYFLFIHFFLLNKKKKKRRRRCVTLWMSRWKRLDNKKKKKRTMCTLWQNFAQWRRTGESTKRSVAALCRGREW